MTPTTSWNEIFTKLLNSSAKSEMSVIQGNQIFDKVGNTFSIHINANEIQWKILNCNACKGFARQFYLFKLGIKSKCIKNQSSRKFYWDMLHSFFIACKCKEGFATSDFWLGQFWALSSPFECLAFAYLWS